MHEQNGLIKRGWKIIVTMKNTMLIDSRLSNSIWVKAMETTNYLKNKLPIRNQNHIESIPKKALTNK